MSEADINICWLYLDMLGDPDVAARGVGVLGPGPGRPPHLLQPQQGEQREEGEQQPQHDRVLSWCHQQLAQCQAAAAFIQTSGHR